MRTLIITTLTLLTSALCLATGPSHIYEKMRPISINHRGDVLCRTMHQYNDMGAHYPMDIEYGFAVVKADTIIRQTAFTLQYKSYPAVDYQKHRAYWDSIYYSPLTRPRNDAQSEIELDMCNAYNFEGSNVARFLVNDTLSIDQLKTKRKIDLTRTPLVSLHGSHSMATAETKDVEVVLTYDFGNIIFFENNITPMDDWQEYSFLPFDRLNPMLPYYYELAYITGVLVKNKNQEK